MGDGVPEGAQLLGRETVSDRVSDILWGATVMPGWTGGTANTAKIRANGQEGQGDTVRCVWREPGKGDITRGRMDISSRRDQPAAAQDIQTVGHGQRYGSGRLFLAETQGDGN